MVPFWIHFECHQEVSMATLTIKNIPQPLVQKLKSQAIVHRRSLNHEVIRCLEQVTESHPVDPESILSRARTVRWIPVKGRLTDRTLLDLKNAGRPWSSLTRIWWFICMWKGSAPLRLKRYYNIPGMGCPNPVALRISQYPSGIGKKSRLTSWRCNRNCCRSWTLDGRARIFCGVSSCDEASWTIKMFSLWLWICESCSRISGHVGDGRSPDPSGLFRHGRGPRKLHKCIERHPSLLNKGHLLARNLPK